MLQNSSIGGLQILNLSTQMNDACITEGMTPADIGVAVQTIYLNNATNINSVTIIPENSVEHEHPLEYMAYYIQNKLS